MKYIGDEPEFIAMMAFNARRVAEYKARDKQRRAEREAAKRSGLVVPPEPRRVKPKPFFAARLGRLRGGLVTAADLAALWKRQRGLCALTGRRLDRSAQLDHIIPRSRGGSDAVENLRWLSKHANQAKSALTDAEFASLCRDVLARC